jgi:hypothetical protein
MAWYAAHIVLYFRLKKRRQKRFVVWENIVLINAKSEEWHREIKDRLAGT